ncbi:protein wings apart-like [Coccinella septempunctata]|uniref:protein wings apart-like n=1 Tax=Coccinella septempunctata TaxID=41139 RepID=UPI001D07E499|nr:protein wings apart-like [Coccinella septempunctata]
MSRGYGKYRRGAHSHASFHFDNIFKENSNKPSAARSAATVGKWGITSFTSIRTVNGFGQREPDKSPTVESAPKPKKFFKSRNADTSDAKQPVSRHSDPDYEHPPLKKLKPTNEHTEKPTKTSVRKFFSSKHNSDKTVLSSNVNNSKANNDSKPPIVLRIFRGKSQLLSDTEESETTSIPSSTSNATSPRALRDLSQPQVQRSPNCRITRSARRSMQQDSPNTADTPGEFSLFMSPKDDVELSPKYIPAEKYEAERRALYDNLLNSSVPVSKENESLNDEIPEELQSHSNNAESMENASLENENSLPEEPQNLEKPEEKNKSLEMNSQESENNNYSVPEEIKLDVPIEEVPIEEAPIEEEPKPYHVSTISKDWLSDSDSNSNSTGPDLEKPSEKSDVLENPVYEATPVPPESSNNGDEASAPPVKLVISKKKGSIFKSRALVSDGTKKRRALYKHKWSDDKDGTPKAQETAVNNVIPDEFSFDDITVKEKTQDSKSLEFEDVKSDKAYTRVKNVKKAHQIQEIGEFQEFNDDVEYILDTLQDNNPISTRCLSAISLASKCMAPAFRMHVRAHGTVTKFFKALHDATKDQSLGLCTATVMFVLSQDRLNMDLDRDCLELMLNLLDSDVSYQQALDVSGLSSSQLEKNKQRVRELCAEIQSQGHAMHLNLDMITVGQLAMETLLSLTSKRAGEWFKEELRELGGLEHIMKTICECCRQVSDYVVSWTDVLLDKLRKIDRCLRVLENVTHNNEENQLYLLKYSDGVMLDTLVNLYKLCDREIPLYPVTDISDKESTGTIIREALLVTLKLFINLTHHFNPKSIGGCLIGARVGIIDTSLHLLLQVPLYIPEQKKFELGVLVLMFLINLIQDNEANQKLLLEAKAPPQSESIYSREESAVEALIKQFYHWEGCAKIAEKRTNAILDGEKDTESEKTQYKSNEEFIEETVAKLLQKAGTHMEFTFLASYIVMLIGFLIMQNEMYQNNVRFFLKGNNFVDMVDILKKFFNFMKMTASTEASSVCAIKTTEKIIKFLEECDKESS